MLIIPGLCGQSAFLKVPHFHQPEETLHAQSLFFEPGGKGYNQAVAARRMGADVIFAGAVGDDADGASCRRRLEEEGVQARMFKRPEHTAFAAILTDARGANQVTVYPGAQLVPDDLKAMRADFEKADMMLITPEIPEAVFAAAIDMALENRLRIILNPAPYAPWVKKYLPGCWCVTPNRKEAAQMLSDELFTKDTPPLPEALRASGLPRVLVTLGSQGALLKDGEEIHTYFASVVDVKDTTGAGDCLSGALCACLLRGMPLREAAASAVRAATLSVQREHVLDGLPYLREVMSR